MYWTDFAADTIQRANLDFRILAGRRLRVSLRSRQRDSVNVVPSYVASPVLSDSRRTSEAADTHRLARQLMLDTKATHEATNERHDDIDRRKVTQLAIGLSPVRLTSILSLEKKGFKVGVTGFEPATF